MEIKTSRRLALLLLLLVAVEAVPSLQIQSDVKSIGAWCNITLHCSVLSKTPNLSYTWKYRNRNSEYEIIDNAGRTFQIMLPLDHQDTEFICVVHYPGDKRHVSLHIKRCSGPNPRHEYVARIKYTSITLMTSFDLDVVIEVIWNYESPKNEIQIAKIKIRNGKVNETLSNRYKLPSDGKDLVIDNVTEADNGLYIAEATLLDATVVKELFTVTAYEPVPSPQIISDYMKCIGDQYNVTIRCIVPSNTSDFSFTWKYREWGSEYQMIEKNESTIQRTLLANHQDMEFVCIVHNPADQKNVSLHMENCSERETRRNYIPTMVSIVLIVSVVILSAVLFMIWQRKKRTSGQVICRWHCSTLPAITSNQNEEENQVMLSLSVQDTETQESTILAIIHEKKVNEEADEELHC